MTTQFFLPELTLRGRDAAELVAIIARWEAGELGSSPGVSTPAGERLPRLRVPAPGRPVHRFGRLADGSRVTYALRLLIEPAASPVLRVGLHFDGPGAPTDESRGGGPLLQALLAAGATVEHAAFPLGVRAVDDAARAEALVVRLLDPRRSIPIVVVSCLASGAPGLAPDALVKELGPMAQVWSVGSREASLSFRSAFEQRKLDGRWSCYDGGVRVYAPGFDPTSQPLEAHPLLLRRTYETADGSALDFTGGWLRRVLVVMLDERGWRDERRRELSASWGGGPSVMSVGDEERVVLQASMSGARATLGEAVPLLGALRESIAGQGAASPGDAPTASVSPSIGAPQAPPVEPEGAAAAELRGATLQRDEPKAELGAPRPTSTSPDPEEPGEDTLELPVSAPSSAPSPEPHPPSTARPDEVPAATLRRRLMNTLTELTGIEAALQILESDLENAEQGRAEAERRVATLEARLNEVHALPQAVGATLELLAAQFQDLLQITQAALKVAATSGFRDTALVSQAVACIALGGGEPAAVRHLVEQRLGKRASYSPKDSPETMRAFGAERQFRLDDGSRVECQQHLTLGHGARNEHTTLHLYFRAQGAGAQILYAGPHLRTVSHDT